MMDKTMLTERVNGMTWGWTGVRGTWTGAEAERSMEEMVKLGVNWAGIALAALQDTPQSTVIRYREHPTVTDDEVRFAIRKARSLGLKVCMKPVVNCANGTWRAHIGFFDEEVPGEPGWREWFAAYGDFIRHYARIAEEEGCEMLCVGCEMVQADKREAEWRELIASVRTIYSGLITYNCDKYQEERVTWWDAVDVLSSSGYYPLGEWERQLDRIEAVVKRWGKPFFFMEAGCPSREHSPQRPNDWSLPGAPSEEAQKRYYEDMFAACAKRGWVRGFMLWDWPARLYDASEAAANGDYCMYGKAAAEVVRRYYTAGEALAPAPAPAPAKPEGGERLAETERDNWRAELASELEDNILAYWRKNTVDDRYFGFVGEIRGDGTKVAEADKGLVLHARILWTFAAAYRWRRDGAYLELARRAFETLRTRFRDPKYGGLLWSIDVQGRPVRDTKQVYGQAFAIYALAELARASEPDAPAALAWAEELYRLLEKHAYDPVHRGYVEALARDWSATDDLALGGGRGRGERKSMNTHLHVLEAYTNLYRVWQPEGLRAKLKELIEVHLDKIVDPASGHFRLFFDDEWRSLTAGVSYGHDIEGSWLLWEAAELLGDEALLPRVRTVALRMAQATLAEGVDADGGVFNEFDGERLDDSKDWWPQAEAMVGFLNAYRLSGDGTYLAAARNSWTFIRTHVSDRAGGEWHSRVARSGAPVGGARHPKVGPWKCPYHNSRACFEALERLERDV